MDKSSMEYWKTPIPIKRDIEELEAENEKLKKRWEGMRQVLKKNSELGFPMGKMANLLYKDFKELEKGGD